LTLTALVLSGPVSSHGSVPDHLSVVRISVATGRQLSVLYQKSTGVTEGWYLSSDGPGRHWLLDGIPLYGGGDGPTRLQDLGFNGWIDGGRLAPLQPRGGNVTGVAW
jgi:hypothetical protein